MKIKDTMFEFADMLWFYDYSTDFFPRKILYRKLLDLHIFLQAMREKC